MTTKTDIISAPISEFVPHSDPMILIDRILDFSDHSLTAEIHIHNDSRFFNHDLNGVEAWVSIEYMAQAIAALAGAKAKLNNEPVKLGFLLGTRKFLSHQPVLTPDNTYLIEVKELFMDESGLGAFQCVLKDPALKNDDTIICEAKLNVFETNDTNQLLN